MLLDQRGTGNSNQQSCVYPEDWQEPADPLPALRKATVDCLAKLGSQVRFYTTSVAVRDLDEVRAALGFDQIDLYGGSYGTRVAELYMRRYPAHVHAVILDGVTYPQQAIGAETPQDAERALNLIIARCLQAPDCAAAYPHLQDELKALLTQFGPQKVMVTIDDPNSGLPLEIEFNRRMLNAALRLLSYSSLQASLLPALIHEAAHGKLRPLAAQSVMNVRQIADQLANGMQYSVICSEDEPLFAGADRAAMAKTYQGTDMVDALQMICGLWPKGPVDADLHAPLHSDIPTLLLSGEADPVTPPVDAERAASGTHPPPASDLEGRGPRPADDRLHADHRRGFSRQRRARQARCELSGSAHPRAIFPEHDGTRAMIEAMGLNKRFGSIEAARDVSFVARDGEITGLLGANGAGKSTCLRMLYGVLTPDSGKACIDGIDIRGETSKARAHLGVLPHAAGLYNNLTARENIRYFGTLHGMPPKLLASRTAELSLALGMDGFIERRAKGFSQGQRIKVALARALVHDPGNVVLDEPTNGLDVMAIRNLREMLLALKAQGRCVLFSSHVMQEVAALCDRVVIIGHGRVLADATVQEIRERSGTATLEEGFLQVLGDPEGVS